MPPELTPGAFLCQVGVDGRQRKSDTDSEGGQQAVAHPAALRNEHRLGDNASVCSVFRDVNLVHIYETISRARR